MKNLIAFSPLVMDISHRNLSRETPVTCTTRIFRGKRVIYHSKGVPAAAPNY